MARGGKREGAGRKVGALSIKTQEVAAAVAEGLTPLEYLTSIYRNAQEETAKRIDAAKAAAPYVHARLSQIEAKVIAELTYEERLKRLAGG